MFEAYGRNKYQSTGVIQWMLNNSWPGLIWHLYDYSLRPAGGYFGTKKALEPLHVQFSYDDRSIAVVNGTQQPVQGMSVVAKLYSLEAKELFSQEARVDVEADGVRRLFAVPEAPDGSTNVLSRPAIAKRFGRNGKPECLLAFKQTRRARFSKIRLVFHPACRLCRLYRARELAEGVCQASRASRESGEEEESRVILSNTGASIAFLVRLRLLRGKDGQEILPVFWDDNYVTLLPGEKREITVRLRKRDLGTAKSVLAVDGYNIPATVE